jgi:OPA family glycerol-3-phosphate transporter-like MFS transporter
MTATTPPDSPHPAYPEGFRARRGLNWGFLGLLYTSFYMCRYNLSIANKSISQEFAFTRADMGFIITTALFAYACGQIINGLLTDRIGGKRAMLIGATGTICMNVLFGIASTWGHFAPATFHGGLGLYEARSSVRFSANDFSDVPMFANTIQHSTNATAVFVREHLAGNTLDALRSYEAGKRAESSAASVLAADLNGLIESANLGKAEPFKRIKFSRGTSELLARHAGADDLRRLNRLILDESFPQEFRKSNQWVLKAPFFGAGLFVSLLTIFVFIRGCDGYVQAFGAPGMVKINAAWFNRRERGRFSGIFGFMINLGRFGIFKLGPALLAGFTVLGLLHVPPLHWRWLFWAPSLLCGLVAVGMAIAVKETPEEIGFVDVIADDAGTGGVRATSRQVFLAIVNNPVVWVTASAYACTGAVRQAVDQWFPRYMQDLYHADLNSASFQFLAFLIPFVASLGSLSSGYISDTLFKGRRAPVAAGLYFLETAIILLAAQFHSVLAAITFFALISFTANSTHSILGSAAPMDIGGRRMAGFALGLIDSFQYFGGSLAGYFLGRLLDKSLGNYFYFMAPFGVIGGLLMLTILNRNSEGKKTAKVDGESVETPT